MSSATAVEPVQPREPLAPIKPVVAPQPPISRGNVYTVARRRPKQAGLSLLQGLGVVVDHWRKSFRKLDDPTQIAGTFTTEYPEERLPLPEAYRNMPILLFDDETGHELCTSCFQCQRICPPQVIHMTQAKDPATGKPVPAVSEFIIEYDACMSCGFCAEVCPFDAIKMDHDFELSTADHPSLTVHKADLLRPVSYYESIAPTFWQAARDNAYKKLANNMKRRPGSIGIAPQLVEKIKAAQLAAEPAPPPPAPAVPPAPAPADDLPTDKAARLAAIRARNQAKAAAEQVASGAPAPAVPPAPTPTEQSAPATPADDKAARLAAIRERNRAKAPAEQVVSAASAENNPPASEE